MVDVDVWILSRDDGPLRADVQRALRRQRGVRIHVHRIAGEPLPTDRSHWETICRARNFARQFGCQPWCAFVDDDVVLAEDCLWQLVSGLQARPGHAALGAKYLDEPPVAGVAPHVAMGATLFRRDVVAQVAFRWEPDRCECQCYCDDLRRLGLQIDYLPAARAAHFPSESHRSHRVDAEVDRDTPSPVARDYPVSRASGANSRPGRILVAFDRRHLVPFRQRFLRSLRAWGNREVVTVVGYGLYPSEQRILASLKGVEVVPLAVTGVLAPIRRLTDFQPLLASWPSETPVAYWDAGDVLFQTRLEPLWQLVDETPRRILAVREPKGYPDNHAVTEWSLTIHDEAARHRAFSLLRTYPFLNSGFAAGTAAAMLHYFAEAERLRHSSALKGTSDWGDQMALNLYCHMDPRRWREVEEGWNYCLHDRLPGEVSVRAGGQLLSRRGAPIHVAHGNARSLRKLALTMA